MNWFPPTSRFLMRTLHQVHKRSGKSVRDAFGADDIVVLFMSSGTLSTD